MCDALDSNKRMEKSFHALYEEAESKHELVALVSGSKRKLEATKTAARYEDGDNETEAFLPGSLIYYFGAFGQPLAIHSGVYIGEGWVVHFWMNPDEVDTKTQQRDALLSHTKGVMVCTRLQEFHPSPNGDPSQDVNIYVASEEVLDKIADSGKRPSRKEAVMLAASRFGETPNYNAFTNNCQHESVFMVTGKRKLLVELPDMLLQSSMVNLGIPDGINLDGFGLDEDDSHTVHKLLKHPDALKAQLLAALSAATPDAADAQP